MTKPSNIKQTAAVPDTHKQGDSMAATATNDTGKKGKRTHNPKLLNLRGGGKTSEREVQETFRCTVDEHNAMVEKARQKGYRSMSDFFRGELDLDPPRAS